MVKSEYTLTDLVDLSLRMPEIGAINFNLLHIVLQTMLSELGIGDVRPSCKIKHPLLDRTELARARMEVDPKKTRSENTLAIASEEISKLPEPAQSTTTIGKEPDAPPSRKEVSASPPPTPPPTQEHGRNDDPDDRSPKDTDSRSREEEGEEPAAESPGRKRKPLRKSEQEAERGWQYTHIDARVEAMEEGLMRLTDVVDMVVEKLRKLEAMKAKGGLEEIVGKIGKLEEAVKALQEESKKRKGGASSAELESLEDRIEVLEEAKLVFDQDHETLSDVVKTQQNMLQEFEEIKALGNEIKDLKNEIAMKAGLKEMEAALALKGDLALVLTKVDQVEFETAIEELGEAIGTLGIKFQNKNEEWEARCSEVWRGIDSKMSRDLFDQSVAKIESRLTALMRALSTLRKVVEQLLYPDSSGVTRCILCRRPAAISGHECENNEDVPKRPHKSSTESSDESLAKENFITNVEKAMKKRQKVDGPPYDANPDAIISIPYYSTTYRTAPHYEKEAKEPQMKLAPISKKNEQHRYEDQRSNGKSQVPKLPEINSKGESQSFSKSRKAVQFSVPKQIARLPHRKLVFTQKMLNESMRSEEEEVEEEEDSNSSPEKKYASTPSREGSPTSVTTDKRNTSLNDMDSFTPLKLMKDPLRREIHQSPDSKHGKKPTLILSPLYPDTSSSPDSSSSTS